MSQPQSSIRIVLADDHPLVLEGLKSCLELYDHIEIVGTASNGREAVAITQKQAPDIILLDINMPEINGLQTITALHAVLPEIRILVLSMHDDKEYISAAIQGGARGYVLKDVSTEEIVTAIEAIQTGGLYFSSGISDVLTNPANDLGTASALTARETNVLVLLAEGRSNKEVARELDISVRTVETHRKNLKRKLGIASTAGLTRYAISHGLANVEADGS